MTRVHDVAQVDHHHHHHHHRNNNNKGNRNRNSDGAREPMVSVPRIARNVLRAGGGRHIVRARNTLLSGDGGAGGLVGGKEAVSMRGSHLTWYACGPTVYDDAHLGHARTYVTFDIIRRILVNCARVPVDLTLGITDVDDKIISRAREANVSPRALARKYEHRFHADMRDLNVLPPTRIARVTDHIPQIVAAAAQLQDSRAAYQAADGALYYSVPCAGEDYGILNRGQNTKPKAKSISISKADNTHSQNIQTVQHKMRQKEIDIQQQLLQQQQQKEEEDGSESSPPSSGPTSPTLGTLTPMDDAPLGELILGDSSTVHKKDARDFALWKPAVAARGEEEISGAYTGMDMDMDIEDEDGYIGIEAGGADPEYCRWDSPWGVGRPGWHVECTAMARSILGGHIDVHSGGVDLKFPHHTNELALADSLRDTCGCAFDIDTNEERWVHTWLHSGHLHIAGRKMSKSLKNFISVRQFLNDAQYGDIATADNFRMFCLTHRYRAGVEFSWDRMRDAQRTLQRLRRFFRDAHKRGNHALSGNVMDTDLSTGCTKSNALLIKVHKIRDRIEEALVDDFDTPKAIAHISQLITRTNRLLDDEAAAGGAAAVVCMEAARVVGDVMGLLGVTGFNNNSSNSNSNSSLLTSVDTNINTKEDDMVDELVALRDVIRVAATNRDWGRVYAACDSTRSRLRERFGIEVRDGAAHGGRRRWERVGRGSPSPFVRDV